MITRIDDLPAGVVGVRLEGLVSGEDYRETMAPVLTEAAAGGDMRMLFEIREGFHMGVGGLVEDAKAGLGVVLHRHSAAKRFAIVSDVEWIHTSIALMGWMSPGEVRVWRTTDRDEAIAWLAA